MTSPCGGGAPRRRTLLDGIDAEGRQEYFAPSPWDRRVCRLIAEAWEAAHMAVDMDYQTLADAIDQFARRGFSESLSVVGNRLRVVETQKTFRPEEVVIREYRRFEGVSDPDDMSIVYAIEADGGTRGTLVDAYGVYSDPDVSAFLSTVPIVERT